MGGSISTGANNDELVDNLLEVGRIKTVLVERICRSVDRAFYFFPKDVKHAYKDFAWRRGNTHLSAPCIYSEVMENLDLEPGLSFLNIGSGTGYLSTMVGLVLGSGGVNHGIELHEDVINYANEKLELFKTTSNALDAFDFCEPVFVKGNCLNLKVTRQYDRVYCGAECPTKYQPFINELIKVGGVLVMPIEDTLMKYKRIDETRWVPSSVLPVSFAPLIIPEPDEKMESILLPSVEPLSLQALCRSAIRNTLRNNAKNEHPEIEVMNRSRPPKKKTVRQWPNYPLVPLQISPPTCLPRIPVFRQTIGDETVSEDSDDSSSLSLISSDLTDLIQYPREASDNSDSSTNHSDAEANSSEPQAEPSSPKKSSSKRESAASSDEESEEETGGLKKRTKRENPDTKRQKVLAFTFQSTPEESSSSSFSFSSPSFSFSSPGDEANESRDQRPEADADEGDTSTIEAPCTLEFSFSSATSNEMEVDEPVVMHRRIMLNDVNMLDSDSDSNSDSDSDSSTKRTEIENSNDKNKTSDEVNEDGEDAASKSAPAITYSSIMKAKVQALPLPHALKCYLNYYREF